MTNLVGPLSPLTFDGHWYILAMIDFTTGFREAVPLKDINSVPSALLIIFSHFGIPLQVLLDNLGANLLSWAS